MDVSIGDPCVYDDFRPNKELLKAVSDSVDANNGYVDFEGIKDIREWISKQYKSVFDIDFTDVFITQGVSMALWMSLCVLCDSGDNFLMP